MKPTPETLPRRWHGPLSWFGGFVLWVLRWRIEGDLPAVPKAVLIVAPHDRTADFPIGIAAVFRLCLDITYLGKASLFKGLLGALMRWLGGIPVDRESSHHVVDDVAEQMRAASAMLLALSPEGTRKKVERWRTGFYYIALQANVPIVPVALDYPQRTIRIGPTINPTGDLDDDARVFERFFGDLTGPLRFSRPSVVDGGVMRGLSTEDEWRTSR